MDAMPIAVCAVVSIVRRPSSRGFFVSWPVDASPRRGGAVAKGPEGRVSIQGLAPLEAARAYLRRIVVRGPELGIYTNPVFLKVLVAVLNLGVASAGDVATSASRTTATTNASPPL